jgi:hypothetical protein
VRRATRVVFCHVLFSLPISFCALILKHCMRSGDACPSLASAFCVAKAQANRVASSMPVRAIKKPACAGFFGAASARRLGQCADACRQAALVASSLVLVDETTRGVTIDDRLCVTQRCFGSSLVLRVDRLHHFLDRRADHGTGAGVALTSLLGLARTLLRGLDVCQGKTPKAGGGKRGEIMQVECGRVNWGFE